jgi:hypothetical protein
MTLPNTAEGNRAYMRGNIRAAGLALEVEAEALLVIAFREQLEASPEQEQ